MDCDGCGSIGTPQGGPAKGEHVTARLIEAVVDHPEVFAQTVFILNYDEAGGFYDHSPQPVPPVGDYQGRSAVALAGELKDYTGDNVLEPRKHPIGLGGTANSIPQTQSPSAQMPGQRRRFAGKIETGKPGRTDPGIGPMRLTV